MVTTWTIRITIPFYECLTHGTSFLSFRVSRWEISIPFGSVSFAYSVTIQRAHCRWKFILIIILVLFFVQNIYYIFTFGCTMVRILDLNSRPIGAPGSNLEFVFIYFGKNEVGLTNWNITWPFFILPLLEKVKHRERNISISILGIQSSSSLLLLSQFQIRAILRFSLSIPIVVLIHSCYH